MPQSPVVTPAQPGIVRYVAYAVVALLVLVLGVFLFGRPESSDDLTRESVDRPGYRVVCNDGWVSYNGGVQGACSHHDGVRRY